MNRAHFQDHDPADHFSPPDTPCIEDSHLDLCHSESYVSPSERGWLQFVKDVEALLGHSLDGNDSAEARACGMSDGYSLDGAYNAWIGGIKAREHAGFIEIEKARILFDAYGIDAYPTSELTTRDVGLAIRDRIEGYFVHHRDEDCEKITDLPTGEIECDCSDADNIVLHLDNGQIFTVRIIAGER